MATIRQRGDRWQAVVKRQGFPTQYKSFDLMKDAEKWARLQEREMDAGTWTDRAPAEQTTFGELLDRYGREVTAMKRGADKERYRLEQLQRSKLGKRSVASITGQVLAAWRDDRLREVSGSTVSREMNLISHIFSVAIKEWGIGLSTNPASLVRKPTSNPARDRVLVGDERERLMAACAQCSNPWIKPVAFFALETAARRGEILNLAWSGVDLVKGVAKVSGKTGARTIPLSPQCIAMLRALPKDIGGKVFPVTVSALSQAFERAVVRGGIEGFTFHDLRHDALTRMARLGFNILELRAVSGHATANMLQRYVSIDAEDLARKLG